MSPRAESRAHHDELPCLPGGSVRPLRRDGGAPARARRRGRRHHGGRWRAGGRPDRRGEAEGRRRRCRRVASGSRTNQATVPSRVGREEHEVRGALGREHLGQGSRASKRGLRREGETGPATYPAVGAAPMSFPLLLDVRRGRPAGAVLPRPSAGALGQAAGEVNDARGVSAAGAPVRHRSTRTVRCRRARTRRRARARRSSTARGRASSPRTQHPSPPQRWRPRAGVRALGRGARAGRRIISSSRAPSPSRTATHPATMPSNLASKRRPWGGAPTPGAAPAADAAVAAAAVTPVTSSRAFGPIV